MTDLQLDAVRDEVSILLSNIFFDYHDKYDVLDSIFDDVVNDIEENADWTGLDDEEYCLDDIRIALARVLKVAVETYYSHSIIKEN